MPDTWSACRCCEVFAFDCPLAFASSSTVRGAWASRSSSSSRVALENALPMIAIASKRAVLFCLDPVDLFKRTLDSLSSKFRARVALGLWRLHLLGGYRSGTFAFRLLSDHRRARLRTRDAGSG